MRRIGVVGLVMAGLLLGCKEGAAPVDPETVDPKSLYEVETKVSEGLVPGKPGTFTLAIRPKPGAEVKAETPLRATVETRGPIQVEKSEIAYGDHARLENKGPVFELPIHATEKGEGEVDVDLTFFICTAEVCLRTKEDISLGLRVQ